MNFLFALIILILLCRLFYKMGQVQLWRSIEDRLRTRGCMDIVKDVEHRLGIRKRPEPPTGEYDA